MPDTGDFERDNEQARADFGWGEVFAALPQETPDTGGWQRLQSRMPAPARPRTRWPLWLATAASLLLAVAIPLKMLPAPPDAIDATPTPRASASVPATVAQPDEATPASTAAPAITREPIAAEPAPVAQRPPSRRIPPSQRPIRTAAQPADTPRLAATDASTAVDLEPLYAQSAQLEGLLALARDERVASGTSAALSDELDSRVARIDAALIQPDLSEAQRVGLWGQRVDALRQLVGIEATNRLYAARGQSYDAALVSID